MTTLAQSTRIDSLPVSLLAGAGVFRDDYFTVSNEGRSAAMLYAVERRIKQKEVEFGHERLLRTLAEVEDVDRQYHIDHYRKVIRGKSWPNQTNNTSLDAFLDDYQRASLVYVDVGFDALRFIASASTKSLDEMHLSVAASEALRGQFGKRCNSGLDTRLDNCVSALEARLFEVSPEIGIDHAVDLLCTPVSPDLTAESALLEDFATIRTLFPEPPTINEILSADQERSDVAWSFLRRFVRWSVRDLEAYYSKLCGPLFEEKLFESQLERSLRTTQRVCLISDLARMCSSRDFWDILRISTAVKVLNHVNLTLEPSFSFKGAPGLPHGLIFTLAEKANKTISEQHLVQRKWELFATSGLGD